MRVPAMPNAHSHAFQRGLRGRAERPAPQAPRRTTSGPGARRCTGWRASSTRSRSSGPASPPTARWPAAGYGAVGEFHYVHHRPDGAPYDDPNATAKAVARAARAAGLPIVLLPAAYARAGAGRAARARASAASATRAPSAFLERVDELRDWADARGRRVGRRRGPLRARGPGRLARGDRRPLGAPRPRAPRTRRRAAARARRGRAPSTAARRSSCSSAPASSGPRASVVHAIHVEPDDVELLAASGTTRGELPDHRGQPGRRPPAAARLPRRRECRSRSAATRRCASTRSRRPASSRRSPAARA